jgi:nucleotidyltransferase substrate binding protein (TIGR01987 family)
LDKLTALSADARRALPTLRAILDEEFSVIVRDAAIQRFEYTFEVVWKLTREHIKVDEGVVSNSPKSCFRSAFQAGLLNEEETVLALEMTDDRNRTVHTYHEGVATAIFARLPAYLTLMSNLAGRLAGQR